MKKPRIDRRSPTFDAVSIPVEYLVIHYTGGSLERALSIFENKDSGVSCHLLVAEDGEIFELVSCWDGTTFRAAHAGIGELEVNGKVIEGFNHFSIGIELVNYNGNVLKFTEAQYMALFGIVEHLKEIYPALQSPERVIGHEHIAGRRGKADPGFCFSWSRFFLHCYPGFDIPHRRPNCSSHLAKALSKFLPLLPTTEQAQVQFWHALNATTEAAVMSAVNSSPIIVKRCEQ